MCVKFALVESSCNALSARTANECPGREFQNVALSRVVVFDLFVRIACAPTNGAAVAHGQPSLPMRSNVAHPCPMRFTRERLLEQWAAGRCTRRAGRWGSIRCLRRLGIDQHQRAKSKPWSNVVSYREVAGSRRCIAAGLCDARHRHKAVAVATMGEVDANAPGDGLEQGTDG